MNATLCREVAKLWSGGFRPYAGEIDPAVYEALGCDKRRREPYWMCRWPILHCLGCARRCTPKSPRGFQAMLPVAETGPRGRKGLSPWELVRAKPLLRVDEVMACLGISRRQAYYLADMGVLVRHVRDPWRVTSDSVLAEMERVDR